MEGGTKIYCNISWLWGDPRDSKFVLLYLQWVIERYSTYTDLAISQWVSIVLSSYFLQVLITFCCLSNDRVLSLLDRAGGCQPKTSEYFWVQISKVGRGIGGHLSKLGVVYHSGALHLQSVGQVQVCNWTEKLLGPINSHAAHKVQVI